MSRRKVTLTTEGAPISSRSASASVDQRGMYCFRVSQGVHTVQVSCNIALYQTSPALQESRGGGGEPENKVANPKPHSLYMWTKRLCQSLGSMTLSEQQQHKRDMENIEK